MISLPNAWVEASASGSQKAPDSPRRRPSPGAPLVALDLWLGAGAVALLVQTAAALGAASVLLGKRGGPFDRVMRLVERSAAEKPDPSKPKVSTKAPRKKSGGKAQAALPAPDANSLRSQRNVAFLHLRAETARGSMNVT